MAEQITTAAELDALPVGSVVLDRFGDATTHDQPGIWTQAETASMGTARLVRYAPFRVLYRPDAPVTAGATVTEWGVRCDQDFLDGDRTVLEADDRADAERIKRQYDRGGPGCTHTVVSRQVTEWAVADGPSEGVVDRG